MKDIPKLLIFIFIGAFVLMFILKNGTGNYEQDSTVSAMTETIRSTAIANRDDASRIKKGQFKIDKKGFEKSFKEAFIKNKNFNVNNPDYKFDYLSDGDGGVKGIKVKVESNGEVYQATTVLSNGKDK